MQANRIALEDPARTPHGSIGVPAMEPGNPQAACKRTHTHSWTDSASRLLAFGFAPTVALPIASRLRAAKSKSNDWLCLMIGSEPGYPCYLGLGRPPRCVDPPQHPFSTGKPMIWTRVCLKTSDGRTQKPEQRFAPFVPLPAVLPRPVIQHLLQPGPIPRNDESWTPLEPLGCPCP